MRQMREMARAPGDVMTLPRRSRSPLSPVATAAATQPPPTLLEAKLCHPTVGAGHIARPGLVAGLDALSGRRLTLITAPAGFGKTTLLAEWIATTTPGHVAWLSLDEGDDDPGRLWGHLVEAVRRALSPALDELVPGGAAPAEPAAHLLNGLSRLDRELVIVVDDHHHLTPSPRFGEQLRSFVGRLPEGVRMVVAARRPPALASSLLRARGQLGEIGSDDLSFDVSEAVRLAGGTMGDRDVEAVVRATGGWPACLVLSLAPGGARHIRDYLTDEVLSEEDPDSLRFLELTAVLDELRGPLCDALLDRTDSLPRLRALARTTPLVTAVNVPYTRFRCEPLVRATLRDRLLEAEPERAAELRTRAVALSGAAVSQAELRVLRLLPTSLTLRGIGAELYLSLNTVKTHTRSLHRKLGVTSRTEAVDRARALGIL